MDRRTNASPDQQTNQPTDTASYRDALSGYLAGPRKLREVTFDENKGDPITFSDVDGWQRPEGYSTMEAKTT